MPKHTVIAAIAVALSAAVSGRDAARADVYHLEKGDHICIIGNTLAERMKHDGWLETMLHAHAPKHELVIRNLGYSGDELTLRLRSANFGSPDEWLEGKSGPPHRGESEVRANRFELANTKADVVFAFFGYNESYAGPDGLSNFKRDLENTLKGMLAKQYNGKSAPRIVLFSPTAFENLKDRNLPDGAEQNKNLKLYTDAMRQVAAAVKVRFVDLFTPTLAAFRKPTGKPHTINGVHLNEAGNELVARLIAQDLFGNVPKHADLAKLRDAVKGKNWHWFHRYRTTDGYSNFGARGGLKFINGQTNYEVLQRESEVLDAMVSNRDKRIWAVAQNGDLTIDDGNTPEFIKVITNKPGKGPQGSHLHLSGEEAITQMKTAAGMKVQLVADEKMFPELINPVQMAVDTKGRVWVAVWPTYPHWKPKTPMNDKLLILEDDDGDGKADRVKAFADDLHNPTGFEFWNNGVLVAQGPDLLYLKDTDGDDKADVRVRVLHGLDTADTHHASNSFVLGPGGALYFQEGTFHHTQVETAWGPPVRTANGAVFRYEPRAQKFEAYTSYGFANPHGHAFTRWGQDFITDGTGAVPYFGTSFTGRIDFPHKHKGGAPTIYKQRTRPCPATEILSSSHFPPENQGNYLVQNVIGFLGILQYKLNDDGSGFAGQEIEPILQSNDPNFRPVDMEIGADGALYFVDWQNPIIGHMQHNLRDPSRDDSHGRVYRVICEGRPLRKPAKIAGEPITRLLDLLKDPDNRVRYRAKIELSGRDGDEVIAATKKWVGGLSSSDEDYEHHVLEALWVHQHHNVVDEALLKRVLRSKDGRARAAATRVLCYWRDRVSNPLGLLKAQVNDEHPRVRLEAVRACSFFETAAAAEIALEATKHPQDKFISYTLGETLRQLKQFAK